MCHTYHFLYPCGHTRTLLTSACVDLTPSGLATTSTADPYLFPGLSTAEHPSPANSPFGPFTSAPQGAFPPLHTPLGAHPNTTPHHATSSFCLGDPGDGCRICMVQDGTLEVETLAMPYARVAGTGARGGRDEGLATRWAEIPNEVIAPPTPMTQAPAALASPTRNAIRATIVERVREFTVRRMNRAAATAEAAAASSAPAVPAVPSPVVVSSAEEGTSATGTAGPR